jgi:hypothetical protein
MSKLKKKFGWVTKFRSGGGVPPTVRPCGHIPKVPTFDAVEYNQMRA